MKTIMKLEELKTIEQISQFLDGTQSVIFKVDTIKAERYKWIQQELVRFGYLTQSKVNKGLLTQYLMKISRYSRQQLSRLIKQYRETGYIRDHHVVSKGFKTKYFPKDIRLVAKMDELYDTPCGHTIKKLCERAYHVFDEAEYERISKISISHLYNIRKTTTYIRVRHNYEKTKFKKSSIGERRKPDSKGQPGYIRIDTVHQGDQDKKKGVYHINAVDEITQFEVVCSVEKISERYLIPILEQMLQFFPFKIISFHSDNGSEYINHHVAKLLGKLLIEFTKSRPRHSNDNALAESKNCSVVRKVLGYQHIPQKYAQEVNQFNKDYLNPHINYHRPCFFPEIAVNDKGKQVKKYPYKSMMTPYDKLKSLENAKSYLKQGLTFEIMDKVAFAITDKQSAERLQKARQSLFNNINERELRVG